MPVLVLLLLLLLTTKNHLKRCDTYIIYKQTVAWHTSSLNICFYSNQDTNDHRNKMLLASDILLGNQALDNLALDIL